jgi:hypothetical protein
MEPITRDIAVVSLPCGNDANLAHDSGTYSYVCTSCFSVVGSVSQPQECQDLQREWDLVKTLGGEGWDFNPRSGNK